MCSQEPFSIDVVTDTTGFGSIEVSCWWPASLARGMDQTAPRFARSVKTAMDEAVVAAA